MVTKIPRMNPGARDKAIVMPKCPRESLTYLRVEGLHCPALLARLLAMLARHALRPVDVQLDRTGKWQRIEITLGGRYYDLPRQLLARVEAVKEVRAVELTDVAGRPFDSSRQVQCAQASCCVCCAPARYRSFSA